MTCGGIAAAVCDYGFTCQDDPTDDCDPSAGGADCVGICTLSECNPKLTCANVITCVDGMKYPSSCGPDNCDAPTGTCREDTRVFDDDSKEEFQAGLVVGGGGAISPQPNLTGCDPWLPPEAKISGIPGPVRPEYLGCGSANAPLFDIGWQGATCATSYGGRKVGKLGLVAPYLQPFQPFRPAPDGNRS
jgi:hypothetical protein